MRSSSEWKVTTATSRPPGLRIRSAAASAVASSPSSSLTKMRSAWNVRVAGWMSSGACATTRADDLGERRGGDDRRLFARARRWRGRRARECRSSPSWKMMSARSRSDACATTSAALGPSPPMRMSSGPSRRNEKPRSASSSCIEETPRSSTTPSTASRAVLARNCVEIGEALFDQRQPAVRRLAQDPPRRDRALVAVDGDDLAVGGGEDRARCSRRRRRCRRYRRRRRGH